MTRPKALHAKPRPPSAATIPTCLAVRRGFLAGFDDVKTFSRSRKSVVVAYRTYPIPKKGFRSFTVFM